MIDRLQGKIAALTDTSIVVLTGGMGFSVNIVHSSQYKKGDAVSLFTYLHWNQEQGPSMFGFATELERSIFLLVISCSGIGPKMGLAILTDLGAEQFLHAIQMADDRALSKVSGIGPKKAEQIIVQLKHKVAKLIDSGVDLGAAHGAIAWQEVSQALESLNYSRMEVNYAMDYLKKSYAGTDTNFDQLLRHALTFLSSKQA